MLERMSAMFSRKIVPPLLIPLLLMVWVFQGCNGTANAPSNLPSPQPSAATSESTQSRAIEMETVEPQPIAGTILATGKILVPENRMANIGPVHEGRLVRLYAGQGSNVSKGQKLADLESADIDQAEADYLKALADSENARRTSLADVKFAQATYDRTRMLYEKSITAGKNVEAAEHDLEMAKASAASVLGPETRSVKVRTEVPNPDGRLKPDMFTNVQIITDLHRTAISIPQAAVLDDNGKSVVFVSEGTGYKKRAVTAGLQGNDRVEIIEGLNAGDKVVVKGNYLLLQQSQGQQ